MCIRFALILSLVAEYVFFAHGDLSYFSVADTSKKGWQGTDTGEGREKKCGRGGLIQITNTTSEAHFDAT